MKTLILLSGFFLVFTTYLIAQTVAPQVVASTGNVCNQNNVQISYTVGEPVIHTLSYSNTILTQGYQQPHYNITVIPEHQNCLPNLLIFPNPVNDNLTIQFNNNEQLSAKIVLLDASGKQLLLLQQLLPADSYIDIPMHSLAAGKYFISIEIQDLNQIKTFEIIKTK